MLTPAEELGLSGLSLAGRVRKAFYQIPEARLVELIQRIQEEATRRHVIYLRDGELDTVRVLPCPLTALPDQLTYIHSVSLTIHNALKRLPEFYLQEVLTVAPSWPASRALELAPKHWIDTRQRLIAAVWNP